MPVFHLHNFTFFLHLLLVLLVLYVMLVFAQEEEDFPCTNQFKCPLDEIIEPCTCTTDKVCTHISIECTDPDVSEDTTSELFTILRKINNHLLQDESQFLLIPEPSSFIVEYTDIVRFDLTPLLNTSLSHVQINWNDILEEIVVGPPGQIKAKYVSFLGNQLTDEGFGDKIMSCFNPRTLTDISVGFNLLTIVPDFSLFTSLVTLEISGNPIERLASGQFERNFRLESLYLTNLGEDLVVENGTFNFNPILDSNDPILNVTLNIDLSDNDLNDESINMSGNGLSVGQRPVYLDLQRNQFEYISKENFEEFLNGGRNKIDLNENPIICDHRMKWLKDQRDKFEHLIILPLCTNDVGHSVFTSSLV